MKNVDGDKRRRVALVRAGGLSLASGVWVSPLIKAVVLPVHGASSGTVVVGGGGDDGGGGGVVPVVQALSSGPILQEDLSVKPIVVVGRLEAASAGQSLSVSFSVNSPFSVSPAVVSTSFPVPLSTSVDVLDAMGVVVDTCPVEFSWEATQANLPPECFDLVVDAVNEDVVSIDLTGAYDDPENQPVMLSTAGTTPSGSTVTPSQLTIPADAPSFIYTASPGFSGTDQFTFTVIDAEGAACMATITINNIGGGGPDD